VVEKPNTNTPSDYDKEESGREVKLAAMLLVWRKKEEGETVEQAVDRAPLKFR